MNRDPYLLISDYCKGNQKKTDVRNYAFCLYYDHYISALKNFSNSNGCEPTPNDIDTIQNSLLTKEAITNYVKRSESILTKAYIKFIIPKASFKIGVLASIVGSFFYSILLIVIFIIAKSQITQWLQALM